MEHALNLLRQKLMSTGLTLEESDMLLAKFLEEEALQFVKCMWACYEDPENNKKYSETKYKA